MMVMPIAVDGKRKTKRGPARPARCVSAIFHALAAGQLRSAEFIPHRAAVVNKRRNKFRAPEKSQMRTRRVRRVVEVGAPGNWRPYLDH